MSIGNSRYLYYRNSLTTNVSYTSNYTNVTISGNRLTIGNSTSRYITLSNSVSTTTSTNSATVLDVKMLTTTTVYLPPSYSVNISNMKIYYVLPETGGCGTVYFTVIGLALTLLPIVYTLHLRRRRKKHS